MPYGRGGDTASDASMRAGEWVSGMPVASSSTATSCVPSGGRTSSRNSKP